MICPNTSHPVWKEMVEALGENRAYFVFDKNQGYIDDERFVELLKTNNRNQAYILRANELLGGVSLFPKLEDNQYQAITDSTGFLIKGIKPEHQSEYVAQISEEIVREIFSSQEGKIDGKRVLEIIEGNRLTLQEYYEEETDEASREHVKLYLDNWNKVSKHVEYYITQRAGITISVTEEEEFEEATSDNAGWFEKRSFEEDASFRKNLKDGVSGRVKQALSFIDTGETNYMGNEKYVDYHEAFATILDELTNEDGTPQRPSWEIMKQRLENSSISWMSNFIDIVDKNKDLQNELVPIFSQHYLNMKGVLYRQTTEDVVEKITMPSGEIKDKPTGKKRNRFWSFILDSNFSSGVKQKLRELNNTWDIYTEDNIPNIPKIDAIIAKINELSKKDAPNKANLREFFNLLGWDISDLVIEDILSSKLKNYKGGSPGNPAGYFESNVFKNLKEELLRIKAGGPNYASSFIANNANMKQFAKLINKYQKANNNLSFGTGGLTLSAYIPNRLFVLHLRDLKANKDRILDSIAKMPFNANHIAKMLQETELAQVLDYAYLDIAAAIKKLKSRSKKKRKLNKLGKREHEVVKISTYFNGWTFKDISNIGKAGNTKHRLARYFYHTMSDKSTMMTIQNIAEDFDFEFDASGKIAVTQETVENVFQKTVMPELRRILHELQKVNSTISGYEQGRFLIHLYPELNQFKGLWEKVNGEYILTQDAINLIKNFEGDSEFKQNILKEFEKILNAQIRATGKKWHSWFYNAEDNNIDFIPEQAIANFKYPLSITEAKNENLAKIAVLAADYTLNYTVHNMVVQQNFTGDPALYWKPGVDNITGISLEQLINHPNLLEAIRNSNDNYHKRLAMDNGPGLQGNRTGTVRYAFANDIKGQSLNQDWLDTLAIKYNINFTDAQEFTTWQEHLNFVKSFGKITEAQYKTIWAKLEKQEEYTDRNEEIPDELLLSREDLKGFVFQAQKPLYSGVVAEEDTLRRVYVKSSTIPLLPQFTIGTRNNVLRKAMKKNKVDRLAFISAVKVGSNTQLVDITQDEIVFPEGSMFDLDVENLKLQQEVPFKEGKEEIGIGSQIAKLIFSDIISLEGFKTSFGEFNGKELYKQYTDRLEIVFKDSLQGLLEELTVNGKVDNKKLKDILQKEAIERNYSITDLQALQLVDGEFTLPLWTQTKRIQALMLSIVDNRVRKIMFPGFSSPLATEKGIEITTDLGKHQNSIIWTDKYKGGGLRSHRYDKDGNFQPSQIVLPWKFRYKGKVLDIRNFMTDGVVDTSKLPPDLLRIFGFRIPTQGLSSAMSFEIVGFLPYEMGDTLITAGDITQQMGSDFDIDKLYNYMYAYNVSFDEELVERKREIIQQFKREGYKEYLNSEEAKQFEALIEYSRESSKEYKERFEDLSELRSLVENVEMTDESVRGDILELFDSLSKEDIKKLNSIRYRQISRNFPDKDFDGLAIIKKIITGYNTATKEEVFDERFNSIIERISKIKNAGQEFKALITELRGIQKKLEDSYEIEIDNEGINKTKNELVNIHHAVISHNSELVKLKVAKPLDDDMKELKKTSREIDAKIERPVFHPLDPGHHADKYVDGSVGKDGVGKFALDSVFMATIQDKEIGIIDPVNITINGKTATGDYSNTLTIESQKLLSSKGYESLSAYIKAGEDVRKLKFKSDNIRAFLSAAVDHENEQILNKINVNTFTFDVVAYLSFEGFDKAEISWFLSQPILMEYVDLMYFHKGELSEFNEAAEREAITQLQSKYGAYNGDKDSNLNLTTDILKGRSKAYQPAILMKFLEMKKHGADIGEVQRVINTDSAGIGKDISTSVNKETRLKNLYKSPIMNIGDTVGTYRLSDTQDLQEGEFYLGIERGDTIQYLFFKPNSINGLASMYALHEANNLFKDYYPHFGQSMQRLFNELGTYINISPSTGAEMLDNLATEYLDFYLTSLITEDMNDMRESYVHSPALHNLIEKAIDISPQNSFLRRLELDKVGKAFEINFSNSTFNDFDTFDAFIHFANMFSDTRNITEKYTFRDLAEFLIKYSILVGNDPATSFKKYIPVQWYVQSGVAEELRSLNFNNLPGTEGTKSKFLTQFLLNYSYLLPYVKGYEKNGILYPKDKENYKYNFIKSGNNVYFKEDGKFIKQRVRDDSNYDFNQRAEIDTAKELNKVENPFFSKVAKVYAKHVGKLKLVYQENPLAEYRGEIREVNGYYDGDTKVAVVNSALPKDKRDRVLVHEVTHYFFDNYARTNHPSLAKTKAVFEAFKSRQDEFLDASGEIKNELAYAATSLEEFIAVFMSNKEVRDYLDTKLFDKNRTWTQAILDAFNEILKALGLTDLSNQQVSQIIESELLNIVEEQEQQSQAASTGFKGYKGGFEDKGKGTPEGDGKDKAMREVADGFIGEIINRNSSSFTSANRIYDKIPSRKDSGLEIGKTSNKAISETVPYTVYQLSNSSIDTRATSSSKIIMLARNSEFKGKVLTDFTKKEILHNHINGAVFIVGDMPNVDSQFIDYLQEIGATFTIYHTGNKSRIQVNQEQSTEQTLNSSPLKVNKEVELENSVEVNKEFKRNQSLKVEVISDQWGVVREVKNYGGEFINSMGDNIGALAKLNEGREVTVHYDSYPKPFKATITGRILVSDTDTVLVNGVSQEMDFYTFEVESSTGKLLMAQIYDIKGLNLNIPQSIPTSTKSDNLNTVVDKSMSFGELKVLVAKEKTVYTSKGVYTMRTSGNEHFGNPFTGSGIQGLIQMPDIETAVQAYKDWLNAEEVSITEVIAGNWSDGDVNNLADSKKTQNDLNDNVIDKAVSYGFGKTNLKFKTNPNNIKGSIEPLRGKEADYLVEEFKTKGQLNPILVDNHFNIIEGRHRLYAAKVLGIDIEVYMPNSEQRQWILSQIQQGKLDNKKLLYMKDKGEYYSHADALAEIVVARNNQPTILPYYEGDIKPEPNTIFVFGSNPVGVNGRLAADEKNDSGGAAAKAQRYFGVEAKEKMDNTLSKNGKAYGLVTVTGPGKPLSKTPEEITENIKKLYEVAKQNPTKQFKVAYRNTDKKSLNGYTGFEMIEMFNNAGQIPSNIIFSKEWFDTGLLNINQPTQVQESVKIEGINIKSDKNNPGSLANRLTNPNWYAKDLMDVEKPYKDNASKIKAPHLNAEEALKYDMNLMYKLQVQKFKRNPELIDEINEKGGLEFIKQSSHILGVKNSRWEGKGMESNFIKVLAQSYTTVAKELGKFKDGDSNNPTIVKSFLPKFEDDVKLVESEKGQIGVNKQQLLMLLGPTMYNKPLAQVAVKELLQNSFDAIKSIQNTQKKNNEEVKVGNIDININIDNRTISVKDNGIGMTPDIVKNAFLSIGGTNKEGLDISERSGGFGLAKVQFLLGSEYVKVITIRNGIKTSLEATGIQLYNDDFIINKETTNELNGSFVEIKIPEFYITPEGTKKEIIFPGKFGSLESVPEKYDILNKPLIGNLNVSVTSVKNGKAQNTILPIGKNNSEDLLPPLFSKIEFAWGTADLYMSVDKKSSPNHRILSSGIFQFNHYFTFRQFESIPYDIVVNIKPLVSSTSEQYPFNNQREDFKNTVKEDIKSLNNFLRQYAAGEAEKEAKAVFSNIVGLPKSDPNKIITPEERIKLYGDIDSIIKENRKKNIEKAESDEKDFRKIKSLVIDDEGVKDKDTGLVEISNEKTYNSSFITDKKIERVDAIETINFNPTLPQYHNNTNVDYLQFEGAAEFFSDFGSVVLETVRFAGKELGYEYLKLNSDDEKFFAGVSIDKQYGGVHVRKIINAIFVNPLAFDVNNLEEAVGFALHVTLHEINHTTVSGEGADFTTALAKLYSKVYGTGKYGLYEGLFRSVYKKHFEVFKRLKNEYEKSSTRNLSESFEGSNLKTNSPGNVQRDVNDVSTRESSEEGYNRNSKNSTEDKTGDIIMSNLSNIKQDIKIIKDKIEFEDEITNESDNPLIDC